MAAQNSGKTNFEQVPSSLCEYLGGKIFWENRCILHRFKDKCVLYFTQDFKIAAKNGGKRFLGNISCSLYRHPGVKNFDEIILTHTISEKKAFCILRRNSRWSPKWWESDFWEKSPAQSAYILGVKKYSEIALSHTISKMNAFLCFMQTFKYGSKNGEKMNFWETLPLHFFEIALSCTISEIFKIFHFHR